MKPLEQRMAEYWVYHTNLKNRLTHFVGVPLVVYSVFVFLAWFRFVYSPFAVQISMATVFYVSVVIYYLRLDLPLAIIQFPFSLSLLILAECTARLDFTHSLQWFLGAFVGGWAFQLWGHYFEGRRPALVDNLAQIFNAPIFLICEALFALKVRTDLQDRIQAQVKRIQ